MSDNSFDQIPQTPTGSKPARYAVVINSGDKLEVVRRADELPAILKAMRDLPQGSYDIVLFSKVGVAIREPARQPRSVVDLKHASTYGKPRKPRDPNAPKRTKKAAK